jgi:multiple sugar transport system permease protein
MVLFGLCIVPLGISIWSSLINYSLITGPDGLAIPTNYQIFLTTPYFWNPTMLVTAIFTVSAVTIEFALGFLLAVLTSREMRGVNFFKSVFIVPIFMMPLAVGILWRYLYQPSYGVINALLFSLGWTGELPRWNAGPSTALLSILIADIWQWTGFMFIILLAGFNTVPKESMESARIDGASEWRILRRIVIPYIMPIISIALFLRLIDAYREFDKVFILTGGGPGNITETLSYHVDRQMFRFFDVGVASAISIFALLLIYQVALRLIAILRVETR